jgi:hypothetical protein
MNLLSFLLEFVRDYFSEWRLLRNVERTRQLELEDALHKRRVELIEQAKNLCEVEQAAETTQNGNDRTQ